MVIKLSVSLGTRKKQYSVIILGVNFQKTLGIYLLKLYDDSNRILGTSKVIKK